MSTANIVESPSGILPDAPLSEYAIIVDPRDNVAVVKNLLFCKFVH